MASEVTDQLYAKAFHLAGDIELWGGGDEPPAWGIIDE